MEELSTSGKTEECGIGKILMGLCLNEKTIHNVANNKENKALRFIKHWITGCSSKVSCDGKNFQKRLTTMDESVKSKCTKIIALNMVATPKIAAHVYLKSALDSKFSQMFIKIDDEEMYPKASSCSVEELSKRYNENGEMVDDKVKVWGKIWFFCLPETPSTNLCNSL